MACLLLVTLVAPARAGDTPVSLFGKSGTDATTGSTATAGGASGTTAAGRTIDWVLSYRNKTNAPANVNITDPITGNHNYVNGSLSAPPGLEPRWSTDGGAGYVSVEPASGVNAVGARGTSVPGATGLQALLSQPLQSFTAGVAAGDGFEPIFIGDNIYNVFHHRAGTVSATLDCNVKATGTRCPGFPVRYVSPTASVPFTDNTDAFGSGDNVLMTPSYNNAAYDPGTGRIWFAAGVVNDTSIGVACANVVTMQSCGYTQLGAAVGPNGRAGGTGMPGMVGGKQIGSRYYTLGVGVEGAPVFCFDTATQAACAGWPAGGVPSDPTYVPETTVPPAGSWHWLVGSLESWGGYLVTNVRRTNNTRDLGCVVIATAARCPGFPIVGYTTAAGINNYSTAPILDAAGDVTGICGQSSQLATPGTFACYSLTGTSLGAPPWGVMVPGATVGFDAINSPLTIGTRAYFAYSSLSGGVATYTCWDFATGAACEGFTPVSSGTDVRPYTLRQDPAAPDCIWELGDRGVFEVFSATFGGSVGCATGSANVTLTPADFYCDGRPGHVSGWNQLQLHGITAADYDAVAVTITDANGDAVPGWTNRVIPSNQVPVDISSIPYGGATTTLNVRVVISWGAHPVIPGAAMSATYSGDPAQVCFQTVVAAHCVNENIDNEGNAVTTVPGGGTSDAPGGNPSGTARFVLPRDEDLCRWNVGVEKRALNPPYVPGTQLQYEIIVTNHGPDPATAVRVEDRLPAQLSFVSASPGCSEAGGTVTCAMTDLAVGAPRTFTVTTIVSASATNTITNPAVVCADKPNVGPTPTTCPPVQCPPAATPGDPHPNVDCEDVPRAPEWDLGIEKTAVQSRATPGEELQFRLVVHNYGPDNARPVRVSDRLPNGLRFVSASPECSHARGVVTCQLAELASGAERTFTVTTRVRRSARRSITNPARVCSDRAAGAALSTVCTPPTERDCMPRARPRPAQERRANVDCATVPVVGRLQLEKRASSRVVEVGETVTFTIRTTNPSRITLRNVRTCDNPPSGLVYVSSRPRATLIRGRRCWTERTLRPRASVTYRITMRVLNGSRRTLVNPATATADNARQARARRTIRVPGRQATAPDRVTG